MTKPAISAALLAAGLLGGAEALAQPALEPGLWRVRVSSTHNGRPQPDQDNQVCLKDELKDPARYFAPELEGVKAKCTRGRVPEKDKNVLGYRLKCAGATFTTEAESRVTIISAEHFTLALRMDSKTPKEQALVEARGEARRIGNCP